MVKNNPFSSEISFEYGVASRLSPLVRRFVARNPGPLTCKGTNSYIIGHGEVTIIDPGPDDAGHVDDLLGALAGETVSRIILTHAHSDHGGALSVLRGLTGATVMSLVNDTALREEDEGGDKGEGENEKREPAPGAFSSPFVPDVELHDNDRIVGDGWQLRVLHTPGHTPDHICLSLQEETALFTGDHVMPWSTSVIAPPEGNMKDYMASLDRLSKRRDLVFYPGHGGRVSRPGRLVRAYMQHRQWREKSILKAVGSGRRRAAEIVPLLYDNLENSLQTAALLNVLAHLQHLEQKGKIRLLRGKGAQSSYDIAVEQ